jgi:MFS family permease
MVGVSELHFFCHFLGHLQFVLCSIHSCNIDLNTGQWFSLWSSFWFSSCLPNCRLPWYVLIYSFLKFGAFLFFSFQYNGFSHKGRRRELIIAAVLYALGGLITAYAPGLGVLLAGRLLYGLGIGLVGFFETPPLLFCSLSCY